jgi:hypothetical protein
MRPICMGPELALPAMFTTTLSREAESRREETTAKTAPSDRDDGVSASSEPTGSEITPVEVG